MRQKLETVKASLRNIVDALCLMQEEILTLAKVNNKTTMLM